MEAAPADDAGKHSTTSYAILGLLSVRSWTTYELAKQVRRSLNWFWPRAERKLYDEPKRLVAQGLATASREYTGLRPRTVYGITDEGRTALRNWLSTPSAPRTYEYEAMLKVFFADAGSLAQLDRTLGEIEAEAATRIADLATMAGQTAAGTTEFPTRLHLSAITLRLQFDQERAILAWAQWARQQASAWDAPDKPGGWDVRAALGELTQGR